MPASQLRIAMLSAHSCPVGNLGAKDTGGMSVYIVELARELGKHSDDSAEGKRQFWQRETAEVYKTWEKVLRAEE